MPRGGRRGGGGFGGRRAGGGFGGRRAGGGIGGSGGGGGIGGSGGGGTAFQIGVDSVPRPLGGYKLYRNRETHRLDPESGRQDLFNRDLSLIVGPLISEDDYKACVGRLNEVVLEYDLPTVACAYRTWLAIGIPIALLVFCGGPIILFANMASSPGEMPGGTFGFMALAPVGVCLMAAVNMLPFCYLKPKLDAETARVQQACDRENARSECSNITWSARKDQTVILAPKPEHLPNMSNAHWAASGMAPLTAALAGAGLYGMAPPTAAVAGAPVVTVVPGQPMAAEAPPVGIVVEPNKGDPGGSSTADTSGEPLAERLIRLKALLDAGALTQQEYSEKRDELLEHV